MNDNQVTTGRGFAHGQQSTPHRPPQIHRSLILPSQNAQIQALCTFKDIMLKSQIIMILKLKITIRYNNDITSPVILILPSLASSPRMRFKSASLIPAHLLSLLRSIFSPLLESIQRIRSLVDCDGHIMLIVSG